MSKLREEFENEDNDYPVLYDTPTTTLKYIEWLESKLEKLTYSKTNICPAHERVVEDGYVQHYCNHNFTREWKK